MRAQVEKMFDANRVIMVLVLKQPSPIQQNNLKSYDHLNPIRPGPPQDSGPL
eukprot:CAMPEP_0119112992 /NCGR_PEP_ID=MMETSP1180-20130426/42412_1 /TAXON_ID=3052 ORGANISM="Chlamydomonas cf sp, Strain CCMP681" /NCGR_SAMPLE_ID=MMETSP1180 /ASSEMBLY_ACC=CAM_ASM_000741 /LENGTH=51 /DNA_ID=CAMNT_0007100799 /DNA_START=253 /DNA_END=408 /DNA_ORIENTATION=+